MSVSAAKSVIIEQLQKEILSLQGFKRASINESSNIGLGIFEKAFPEQTFPIGAIHEFISTSNTNAAATNGFISGIVGKLMQHGGACLWISTKRTIFPPALKFFGIDAE